jgi:metaxin
MSAAAAATPSEPRGLFAVPAPVRELFKLFPLHVYPAEPLPARTVVPDAVESSSLPRPRLFVFSNEVDALNGRPSYNPSCLKWQVRHVAEACLTGVSPVLLDSAEV